MIVYLPQERAFASTTATEWPDIIAHPTDKNGRLVKMDISDSIMYDLIASKYKEGGKKDGKEGNVKKERKG